HRGALPPARRVRADVPLRTRVEGAVLTAARIQPRRQAAVAAAGAAGGVLRARPTEERLGRRASRQPAVRRHVGGDDLADGHARACRGAVARHGAEPSTRPTEAIPALTLRTEFAGLSKLLRSPKSTSVRVLHSGALAIHAAKAVL